MDVGDKVEVGRLSFATDDNGYLVPRWFPAIVLRVGGKAPFPILAKPDGEFPGWFERPIWFSEEMVRPREVQEVG